MRYADHTRYTAGALVASLSAGPVFLLSGTLVLAGSTSAPIALDLSGVSLLAIVLIPLVVLVGFAISIIPIIIGGAVLAALGGHNIGARLPVFWAIIGGISAIAAARGLDAPHDLGAAVALTGAVCALLCRRGTIWSEPGRSV